MERLRNQNGITLLTIIIIVVVIVFLITIMSGSSKYELTSTEGLSLYTLRYAIAQSNLDGTGTISTDDFNTLGEMVKNANSSNQWFSGKNSKYYVKMSDTSNQEITYISDGNYIAKFTVEIENPDSFTDRETFLVDYSFEEGTLQGSSTSISIID